MSGASSATDSRNDYSSGTRGGRGGGGRRGRSRGRGRGRGSANATSGGGRQTEQGRQGRSAPEQATASAVVEGNAPPPAAGPGASQSQVADVGENDKSKAPTEPDVEICFICANPVVHYSVTPCNHRTCHICGLRMRALYKNKDCPHCRTLVPFVIFTDDPEKPYDAYSAADITSTDDNIGIRYANEDIVGDTVLLLRYNCPDPACDFAALGWPDLHRHVRSSHKKKMCDLCTRNKKVFTHEHELFQDKELEKHMRYGDDRPGAADQTGFKGHPLCGFCGQRFYDDDKLFEHCRNRHERCFICDRRDSRKPHYYQDYNALERHFREDHFLCMDKECLEKKFVVFESELDLKAHQLSEHGSSLSKDVRRDARIVDMSAFDYRPSYQREQSQRRGERAGRGRGQDPGSEPLRTSSSQPLRRDELAFQRQLAIHSAQSVSNRNFGSQLSSSSSSRSAPPPANRSAAGASSSSSAAQQSSSTPVFPLDSPTDTLEAIDITSLSPQDRARLTRHRGVIERAQTFLGNDAAKMARFRQNVSSYKNGKLTASQFIDVLFALFSDTSSNSLGILIRELADLFEDQSKADALRKAWQDWRAINEDYPSLPGLGGMRGATTASSGWAAAAMSSPAQASASASQKHSNRVLRLKSSTRQSMPGAATSSASSSWTAPPSVATRSSPPSSSFPALPSVSQQAKNSSATSSSASKPSWVASASQGSKNPAPSGPPNGEDAFPALPAAPKPLMSVFGYGRGSVKRDWGSPRDTGFSWGAGNSQQGGAGSAQRDEDGAGEGGKKKGNKGKKQVLVQWG